jgi:hypothetical protein
MSYEVKSFNFAPRLDFFYAFKPKNSAFNAMWLKTRHYGNIKAKIVLTKIVNSLLKFF